MALRKIAQLGEPVLRQTARALTLAEIHSPALATLIDDMIETMRDVDGAGLAAPQVYESVALAILELRHNPRYPGVDPIPLSVFINPKLTPIVSSPLGSLYDRDAMLAYEGCLSVTGIRGRVRRPRKVRIEALDREGRAIDEIWEGFHAVVVQHETDHLNGTLFIDRAEPKTLMFLREYERHVAADERIIDLGRSGR